MSNLLGDNFIAVFLFVFIFVLFVFCDSVNETGNDDDNTERISKSKTENQDHTTTDGYFSFTTDGLFSYEYYFLVKVEDFCSGVIVNSLWVLTTIHCEKLAEVKAKESNKIMQITAGEGTYKQMRTVIQRVKQMNKISSNHFPTINPYSLLKLKIPLKWNPAISPATFNSDENIDLFFEECTVVGFGKVLTNGSIVNTDYPIALIKSEISREQDCPCNTEIFRSGMCVTQLENLGPCTGDYGSLVICYQNHRKKTTYGFFMYFFNTDDCAFIVPVGGAPKNYCVDPKIGAFYGFIVQHHQWIMDITNSESIIMDKPKDSTKKIKKSKTKPVIIKSHASTNKTKRKHKSLAETTQLTTEADPDTETESITTQTADSTTESIDLEFRDVTSDKSTTTKTTTISSTRTTTISSTRTTTTLSTWNTTIPSNDTSKTTKQHRPTGTITKHHRSTEEARVPDILYTGGEGGNGDWGRGQSNYDQNTLLTVNFGLFCVILCNI